MYTISPAELKRSLVHLNSQQYPPPPNQRTVEKFQLWETGYDNPPGGELVLDVKELAVVPQSSQRWIQRQWGGPSIFECKSRGAGVLDGDDSWIWVVLFPTEGYYYPPTFSRIEGIIKTRYWREIGKSAARSKRKGL